VHFSFHAPSSFHQPSFVFPVLAIALPAPTLSAPFGDLTLCVGPAFSFRVITTDSPELTPCFFLFFGLDGFPGVGPGVSLGFLIPVRYVQYPAFFADLLLGGDEDARRRDFEDPGDVILGVGDAARLSSVVTGGSTIVANGRARLELWSK
jgi:hypothetical protein